MKKKNTGKRTDNVCEHVKLQIYNYHSSITINVPLILKVWDVMVF
jgi:hypothetical protein